MKTIRFSPNRKGFTLLELLVVIVIIGILAAIVVPRYMSAQDRACIGAARNDVDLFRQALGMFEIDNADYPDPDDRNSIEIETSCPADELISSLVDPQGKPYMALPEHNFAAFRYSYDGDGALTTYTIEVTCKDNAGTVLEATPEDVKIQ